MTDDMPFSVIESQPLVFEREKPPHARRGVLAWRLGALPA